MKKYLIFVMGIVIGIVGTSYAAYKLKAEQVSFDKTNTNLNSENVQDSIDELATDILSYGDAEAGDIASGKTALVKGKKITGSLDQSYLSKVTKIGSVSGYNATKKIDIKSLTDNYSNLTNNNFILSGSYNRLNYYKEMSGYGGCTFYQPSFSYSASTGILTVTNGGLQYDHSNNDYDKTMDIGTTYVYLVE